MVKFFSLLHHGKKGGKKNVISIFNDFENTFQSKISMIIARIPEIKPFNRDLTKNGFLIKLDLAPTNCMVLIENLSEYTAKRMVMLIKITEMIKKQLPDAEIEISDLRGDNNHYHAKVQSKSFKGLSKIKQHQLVYKALGKHMGSTLHALMLTTKEI